MKVTAIVPAYNEEKTVEHVLNVLTNHPIINEVISVNDGSTDNTLGVLNKIQGVKVVSYSLNHGKGYALAIGIERAKGDAVLFIDADLTKLNEEHVTNLIKPVLNKEYDATIGVIIDVKIEIVFQNYSGQRCYLKRDVTPLLHDMKSSGRYGVEPILNAKLKHLHTKKILLTGMGHILKGYKRPLLFALWEFSHFSYAVVKFKIKALTKRI